MHVDTIITLNKVTVNLRLGYYYSSCLTVNPQRNVIVRLKFVNIQNET